MSPSLRVGARRYVLDANALIGFFEGRLGVSERVRRLLGETLLAVIDVSRELG